VRQEHSSNRKLGGCALLVRDRNLWVIRIVAVEHVMWLTGIVLCESFASIRVAINSFFQIEVDFQFPRQKSRAVKADKVACSCPVFLMSMLRRVDKLSEAAKCLSAKAGSKLNGRSTLCFPHQAFCSVPRSLRVFKRCSCQCMLRPSTVLSCRLLTA